MPDNKLAGSRRGKFRRGRASIVLRLLLLPGKDYGFPQLPSNCCQQIYGMGIILTASCSVAFHIFMNIGIIIVITAITACIDIPICVVTTAATTTTSAAYTAAATTTAATTTTTIGRDGRISVFDL
jgi:hypothetical protein